VQLVVDDGLSLLWRGLTAQHARAETRGHGNQAERFQIRVQPGGRVPGGLSRPQLRGDHVDDDA
jgi:hypothetical protein